MSISKWVSQLFSRENRLDVDLGKWTLEDVVCSFPNSKTAGQYELYLLKQVNVNEVVIGYRQAKVYESGVHFFKYNPTDQYISIKSLYRVNAYLVYLYAFLPFILYLLDRQIHLIILLAASSLLFIAISLIQIINIKDESRTVEREMIININYLLRNNRRNC